MHPWAEVARLQPALAVEARELLYQFGVGLAFMSTVRADGGPRLHPICPVLTDDGLFAFIVPSPKRLALHRDGRYALHSFPAEANEDAVYLTGRARPAPDPELRKQLGDQFAAERATLGIGKPPIHDEVFEFHVDALMLTRTTGHGDASPVHTVWRAAAPAE